MATLSPAATRTEVVRVPGTGVELLFSGGEDLAVAVTRKQRECDKLRRQWEKASANLSPAFLQKAPSHVASGALSRANGLWSRLRLSLLELLALLDDLCQQP